jgi:putative acetyltransferase
MYTLRRGLVDDVSALARIHIDARAAAMPDLPVIHSAEDTHRFFANLIARGVSVTVAVEDDHVCGFSAAADGWIQHLYVSPPHWRQGIGRKLIAFEKASAQSLQLWTFQQNTMARAFYARHGFVEAEFTDGAGNEERVPDVRLIWKA